MDHLAKLMETCEMEEQELQFTHFTREDALELGLQLHRNSAGYPAPIAIEITVNGLAVFRYFQDGAMPESELWLARKRRLVDLMQMSSMHVMAMLETDGDTLAGRKLNPNDYAACGGGFPIIVRGVGCIGSVCVSGMPDHHDDHRLLIETLTEYLA